MSQSKSSESTSSAIAALRGAIGDHVRAAGEPLPTEGGGAGGSMCRRAVAWSPAEAAAAPSVASARAMTETRCTGEFSALAGRLDAARRFDMRAGVPR